MLGVQSVISARRIYVQPSKKEAFSSIPGVLYAIDQCLALNVWVAKVAPTVTENLHGADAGYVRQIIHNAVFESVLLSIRRLNEFFSKKKPKSGDESLRASHFGNFTDNGWFLKKEEYDELHLSIGHMSVKEVRQGKKQWPIGEYVQRALDKACAFLQFLRSCPETSDDLKSEIETRITLISLSRGEQQSHPGLG